MDIPDDISSLFATAPTRVVYLMPLKSPKIAAAMCALLDIDALCLPSQHGVAVVGADTDEDAVAQVAARFTSLHPNLEMLVLRRGPSNNPAAQDVQASRWQGGEQREELPAGLILSTASSELERLIVALEPLESFTDGVQASSLTKPQALKILASRRARKETGQ